ncbi:MAG: transglycosylase SLT domain-containing protein [Gemmatimonadota bacterium]|nr:transglycosylase SLT domain-containing protein [Gemmatimonadota bacterium]
MQTVSRALGRAWAETIVLLSLLALAPQGALGQNGALLDPWHQASDFRELVGNGPVERALVLRAVEAEVRLGRPGRAMEILASFPLPASIAEGAPIVVSALASFEAGRFEEAARKFLEASRHAGRFSRGVWEARAADAFERAGLLQQAHENYRLAATRVREVSDWLLVRAVRTAPDSSYMVRALEDPVWEVRSFAFRTRGRILIRAGNLSQGLELLAESGALSEAARLALENGDSQKARSWVYEALEDPAQRDAALEMATGPIPARSADEFRTLAVALRRSGDSRAAIEAAAQAVRAGDSIPSLLLFEGEVLEVTGNRTRAIEAYRAASQRRGRLQVEAHYRYARGLTRAGRRDAAYNELARFVDLHAEHERAAAAQYLMADLRDDQGRSSQADSLYRVLHERWPNSDFASDARARLAQKALSSRDSVQAMDWLAAEVLYDGSRSQAANYQLAELYRAMGDTAQFRRVMTELARSDSLGYYGTLARPETNLGPLRFSAIDPVAVSERIHRSMTALDFLDQAGFQEEAELLVSAILQRDDLSFEEMLDVGEGLGARGRARAAVSYGWRIARLHYLNHPRVLRIIFPWPNQQLVVREAQKFGVDPYLLVGLIRRESAFDEDATSVAGARGMTQLMPTTADWLARRLGVDWDELYLGVADANIHVGAAHLSEMLENYDGAVVPALAAYNAGGSRVQRWLRFPEAGDWVAFTERIPFNETRIYVREVLRNRAVYRALYGSTTTGTQ